MITTLQYLYQYNPIVFGFFVLMSAYLLWMSRNIIMLLIKNLVSVLIEFNLFEFVCSDKFTEDSVNECERVYPIISKVSTPVVEKEKESNGWSLFDYYLLYKIFGG